MANKKWLILVLAIVAILIVFSLLILPYYISGGSQSNNTLIGGILNSNSASCNDLQNQVQTLQNIVNLQYTSTVGQPHYAVNQPAGGYSVISFHADYAGYVVVNVESSTTSKTWVQVVVSSPNTGNIASQQYSVGTAGTVYFPVLPGEVYVYIGNSNLVNGASETVTITYVYWYISKTDKTFQYYNKKS